VELRLQLRHKQLANTSARAVLAMAATVSLLAVSGCLGWERAETHLRYKLTATVESAGQSITASAVQEMRVIGVITPFSNQRGISTDVIGQAISVEIPNVGTLYLLMASRSGDRTGISPQYLQACGLYPQDAKTPIEQVSDIAAFRGSCDVPRRLFPMMVTVGDPTTGADIVDRSDEAVQWRVTSLRLEVTDEPILFGLEQRFPWLYKSGPPIPVTEPHGYGYLSGSEFSHREYLQ